MKRKYLALLFLLLIFPVVFTHGQANTDAVSFDTSDFPQWARDLRRFDIVAFGTFPFTMFASIFAMDTYRWVQEGMDWSDSGRRYAPWPLKSAGAVDMTNKQYEMTMLIAAGASIALATIDFAIVQIKRHRIRRRTESMPAGSTIIIRQPWPPEMETEDEQSVDDTAPER